MKLLGVGTTLDLKEKHKRGSIYKFNQNRKSHMNQCRKKKGKKKKIEKKIKKRLREPGAWLTMSPRRIPPKFFASTQ